MSRHSPIPVTILTGFLGAGKTTLLNSILRQKHTHKFGVILNEMADIGIDDQLVELRDEEVMLMKNGCICCTVRTDLVRGIQQLLKRGGFDYLLIETTGIANPTPIVETFYNLPALSSYVRLDSIATVVDAEQIGRQAQAERVAADQIAMADFILLNKIDLVSAADLQKVETAVRSANPHARIFRSTRSEIDLHQLLDVNAFNVDGKLVPHMPASLAQDHEHGSISSVALTLDGLFDGFKLESFVQQLSVRERVYRSKGIVAIAGSRRRAVFHGVNNRFTIFWDRAWKRGEPRQSQLVFIGKALQHAAIDAGLRSCLMKTIG
jgi:G3E family GTPase